MPDVPVLQGFQTRSLHLTESGGENSVVEKLYIDQRLTCPFPINVPKNIVWIFITEKDRQSMGPHIVVALQHRKSNDGTGNPNRGKSGMSRGRKRSPMVHRRRNCHSSGHFVVQYPANPLTQMRFDLFINSIINVSGVGIQRSCQIAL